MSCTNLSSSWTISRLIFGVCTTALLGLAVAGCPNPGGSNCPDGEAEFRYPANSQPQCYKTCQTNSDCPNGQDCIGGAEQKKLCDPSTGNDQDAMSDTDDNDTGQDTFTPDTQEDTGTDGGDTEICSDPGTNKCREINTCTQKCSQDNIQGCLDNCIGDGTCQAQRRFNAYRDCISTKCGENSGATCIQNKCEQPLRRCGLVGNASCDKTRKCTTKCIIKVRDQAPENASDQQIRELFVDCQAQECEDGTLEAQKQSSRISACVEQNNCNADDAETACRFKNCESQYKTCGLLGNNSCRETTLCNAGCGDSDYQCQADCVWKASKEARVDQGELGDCLDSQKVQTCIQNNNGKDQFDCRFEKCEAENKACERVGGFKNCSTASDCNLQTQVCQLPADGGSQKKCVNDSCDATFECFARARQNMQPRRVQKCIIDSTAQAQKRLFRYFGCLRDNSTRQSPCRPGSTCAQNNCGTLDSQCFPDEFRMN